jgi:signal transduction histidine kinase
VAVLLTVMLQIEVWVTGPVPHQLVVALLGPLVTLAVAVRRLHPVAVGVGAGLLGDVVAGVWGPPSLLSYGLAWICCMYGFAVWSPPRPFAIGLTVIAVGGLVSAVGPVSFKNSVQFVVVSTVVILLVNRVVGDRERRAQIAERERDLASREAVVEERARIARELHDVVAHHMSLIAVRAETAPYRLDGVPAPVAEEFTAIAEASREALTEMRRLLGVLRSATPPEVHPQPGLADLGDLVTAVREAGVEAYLDVEPGLRVPAGVGLTAYRIVQEALSNASRHASGAPVRITLRTEADALAVYVVNGPGFPAVSGGDGGSHGLVGLRERATMLGGSFAAGPTAEGGFAVRATLPMTGSAADSAAGSTTGSTTGSTADSTASSTAGNA